MRLGIVLALLLLALPAAAHRMTVFVAVEGSEIAGQARFIPSGHPHEGAVKALGLDGSVLYEGELEAEGRFSFPIPARQTMTIAVTTSDGHAATARLEADELPAAAAALKVPPPAPEPADAPPLNPDMLASAVEQAIAPHITALRSDIAEQQSQTRLRDIIGGIGYIAGILGLVMYAKARQANPAQ